MRAGAPVGVVAAVAAIAVRWAVAPGGITNDGPQHLWAAFVGLHKVAGYTLNRPLSANGGVHLLESILWAGASPLVAMAVVGAVASIAIAGGFTAMCLLQHRGRWPAAILGIGLSQQLATVAGTIPYCLALAGAGFLVAIRSRPRSWSRTSAFFWSLALVCVGWVHIVPAFLAWAFGTLVALTEAPRDIRRLAANVGAGLPLGLLTAASSLEPADVGARSLLLDPRLDLLGALLPQSPMAEWPLYALAAVAVVLAIRRRTLEGLRGCGAGLAVMAVAAALADDAFGWNLMRERLWAIGAMCIVATLDTESWSERVRHGFTVGAIIWSAWVLVASTQADAVVATFTRPVLEATSALGAVEGRWAPVVTIRPTGDEPRRGRLAAWLHIGQVIATTTRGQPAYAQDDSAAIHSILRPEALASGITTAPSPAMWPRMWNAPPERRAGVVSAYAAWGATIPRLVVYGPLEEQALFVARGHVVEQTTPPDGQGNVAYVTRFVGCDVDAHLAGDATVDDVVEVGFFPAVEPLSTFPVAAGRTIVHLHDVPCGDGLWFRLQRAACQEAPPSTRVPLPTVSRDAALALPCTPAPRP